MNSGAANSSFCKRVSFAVKVLFIVSCSEELVVVNSVIDVLMVEISEFVAVLLLSAEVVRLSILSLTAVNDCSFNVLCSSRVVLMFEISLSCLVMSSFIDCLMVEISELVAVLLLSAEVVRLSILSLIAECSDELVVISSDMSD